ncbi:hypothetical protein HBB16_20200 [Pseudonocardia sp. MCCB 268]|nr:hypothetical protein [Pseudonocardia cytotoxica]
MFIMLHRAPRATSISKMFSGMAFRSCWGCPAVPSPPGLPLAQPSRVELWRATARDDELAARAARAGEPPQHGPGRHVHDRSVWLAGVYRPHRGNRCAGQGQGNCPARCR